MKDSRPIGFELKDVFQLVVGAAILGVPIAYSEESWKLGAELSGGHIAFILFSSLLFLSLFAYVLFYQSNFRKHQFQFFLRVTSAYLLTVLVVAIILGGIDKLPLIDAPMLALKRVIVVAFPACFSATIFDSLS